MKCDTGNIVIQPNTSVPYSSDFVSIQSPAIKVMVQDRHNLFLQGFCQVLNDLGFKVTAEARDHISLMHAIFNQGLPDLSLIEFKTESQVSLIMAREIKGAYPEMKLMLMITQQPNENIPIEYMKMAGINGIIDKRYHSIEQVEQAIITVYNGGSFFDKTQTRK